MAVLLVCGKKVKENKERSKARKNTLCGEYWHCRNRRKIGIFCNLFG